MLLTTKPTLQPKPILLEVLVKANRLPGGGAICKQQVLNALKKVWLEVGLVTTIINRKGRVAFPASWPVTTGGGWESGPERWTWKP